LRMAFSVRHDDPGWHGKTPPPQQTASDNGAGLPMEQGDLVAGTPGRMELTRHTREQREEVMSGIILPITRDH